MLIATSQDAAMQSQTDSATIALFASTLRQTSKRT
jgi:hypothetical protein